MWCWYWSLAEVESCPKIVLRRFWICCKRNATGGRRFSSAVCLASNSSKSGEPLRGDLIYTTISNRKVDLWLGYVIINHLGPFSCCCWWFDHFWRLSWRFALFKQFVHHLFTLFIHFLQCSNCLSALLQFAFSLLQMSSKGVNSGAKRCSASPTSTNSPNFL